MSKVMEQTGAVDETSVARARGLAIGSRDSGKSLVSRMLRDRLLYGSDAIASNASPDNLYVGWDSAGLVDDVSAFYRRYMGVDHGRTEGSVFSSMMMGDWTAFPEPVALVDAPGRKMLTSTAVAVDDGSGDARARFAIEVEALLGYTPLREYVKVTGLLRRVLAKLEIEPLDEASVNTYKAQMVRHYATHKKLSQPTWRLTQLADFALPVPEFVLRKAVAIKKALPQARFYVDHLAVDPFLIVSLEVIPDGVFNVPSRKLDPETQAYIEVWLEPKFEASV
jgi:hypothetical protein